MFKKVSWMFLALLTMGSFLSPFPAHSAKKPTLSIVFPSQAPPLSFKDKDGKIKGSWPSIARHILDKLDIEPKEHIEPWGRCRAMVKDGLVESLIDTPIAPRHEYAVFSKGVAMPVFWNLYITAKRPDLIKKAGTFKNYKDLEKYNFVDFLGNKFAPKLAKMDTKNFKYVKNIIGVVKMIVTGRHDMGIIPASYFRYWAAKGGFNRNQYKEVSLEGWPWARTTVVFQLSKKSPWLKKGLVKAWDKELALMIRNGKYAEIFKKWYNPISDDNPEVFKSWISEDYFKKNKIYADYDKYPLYVKPKK